MSIEVMTWVWKSSETKASHRLVLLALADNANDQGECWPSIGYIANKCRLSKRYTIDILKDLETAGHIEIINRSHTSNLYKIIMGVVNQASLGSEAGLTRGSEAERGGVVRRASLKPSYNHHIEPSINNDKEKAAIELKSLVNILAQVTRQDVTLNYGRLSREAKALQGAGYKPFQIEEVYGAGGAWWTDDWRGKQGQPPQIGVIRSTIHGLVGNGSPSIDPDEQRRIQKEQAKERIRNLKNGQTI